MSEQEKVLIQIGILRAKLFLKEAETEGFAEAKDCLKKEIVCLYTMLHEAEPSQGIHENLIMSEKIEIRLNNSLV